MRGRNASFRKKEEGVALAKKHDIKVVLTTMVGGSNMIKVPRIAEIIERLQPDAWRMLEYSNRENTADRHNIARSDFAFYANWASRRLGIPVMPSDNDLNAGCFIIDQLGNRQIPTGDTYVQGPNCLEVPIDEMWANDPQRALVERNKYWQKLPGSEYMEPSQLGNNIVTVHDPETILYVRQSITTIFS